MMSKNENEKRETVADVVAEYRNDADAMDRGWLYQPTTEYVRRLLDRIEAAWKREARAIATEHAVLPAVCITKPSGNAAAMREALVKIHGIAKTFMDATRMRHVTDSAIIDVGDIEYLANAALSAPPRNCDVGTAEEQDARFVTWRYSEPLRAELGLDALQWAQMPYEAKEGVEK